MKKGGSWIITLENGIHIATGHNPNFGHANKTSSFRTEVYASLVPLLFSHHYTKYYKITLNTKFTVLCDNEAYVKKLQQIMEDPYQFSNSYKNKKPEVITIILQCILDQFTIYHVFGHQND